MAIGMCCGFSGDISGNHQRGPEFTHGPGKGKDRPRNHPFPGKRQNNLKKGFELPVPESVRHLDEIFIHGFDGCPGCLDHQGKGYNKGSQNGSVPCEHDTPAGPMKEVFPEQAISSHKQNQIVSCHSGRKYKGKRQQDIQDFFPSETLSCENERHPCADQYDQHRCGDGNLKREP